MVHVATMNCQDRNNMVYWKKAYVHVVRRDAAELRLAMDMCNHTTVRDLDAFWHAGGAAAELVESNITWNSAGSL
eukprot:CAMPEP_0115318418 /NCGR_PEP_ID=MMETSP0270-20121206/79196_1 /TAXON_ID=71861 /ORGANISM="Scrippsiella trochoidea, Strain CCMP3099" /LENGTH=74 /DNA_ID=CAMNT_0002737991 /DNA_START=20 /DNA_END=244 /DNA_ORIENTATION=-